MKTKTYVSPGSYYLKSSEGDNHLTFINPDGKIVLIVVNKEDTNKTIRISVRNQEFSVEMKAKSFNTFCIG